MENFFLGEYIKQRREALGLTQKQVCEGICDPVTLSRLENGKQTPNRTRINAILQRLGLPDDRYISLLSKNELKIEALKKEIVACNATERVKEGREKLAKLEEMEEAKDPLVRQFILRAQVLLGRLDGSCLPEKQIELLFQAIRLTVPQFDLDKIEWFLYSTDEVKIINQIGIAYSDDRQNEKAAEIYAQLLRFFGQFRIVRLLWLLRFGEPAGSRIGNLFRFCRKPGYSEKPHGKHSGEKKSEYTFHNRKTPFFIW